MRRSEVLWLSALVVSVPLLLLSLFALRPQRVLTGGEFPVSGLVLRTVSLLSLLALGLAVWRCCR